MSLEAFQDKNKQSNQRLLDETNASIPPTAQPVYVLKVIRLNPGISKINFYCCMLFYMVMIFGLVTPGLLQPLIILDKGYYNIGQDEAGRVSSLILIIQLAIKILVSIPYGHMVDKFGRRPMIVYGACSYLASCLLVPIQTTIFPGFIFAKALYANATSAFATIPLLADYIDDESKGKAAGFSAMLLSLAAVISNLFLKTLFYAGISLGTCYVVTGSFVFLSLCLITLGLKGGKYYHTASESTETADYDPSLVHNFVTSMKIFKSNGWLMIALVLQCLGSSDFIVFFTFMTLYVKSLFPANVTDNAENIVINNLQTLVFVTSFLCNFAYGIIIDRKHKIIGTSLFALIGGMVSFIFLITSHDPYSFELIVAAIVMGASIPGLFVISTYLGIKHFPPEKRGIMISVVALVGYMGYFVIASLGGLAYDKWRKDGPFIICMVLLGVASIAIVIINKTMNKKPATTTRDSENEDVRL